MLDKAEYMREWRKANPDKDKAQRERYRKAHPDKIREYNHRQYERRKALRKGSAEHGA